MEGAAVWARGRRQPGRHLTNVFPIPFAYAHFTEARGVRAAPETAGTSSDTHHPSVWRALRPMRDVVYYVAVDARADGAFGEVPWDEEFGTL